ncbi:MAG TPA: helicase-related protein, partial [Chthoniobacteraceae bacterium]|nr:helicase-related protein [Chthoniobacteraceae bacterium]
EEHGALPLFEGRIRVPRVLSGVPPESSTQTAEGAHYSRRRLPHFERPWAKYAITFSTKKRVPLPPDARTITLDAIRHFDGKRYELYAACVMHDHVHFLIEPQVKENDSKGNAVFHSLAEILHSIKSYTSHKINQAQGKSAAVWEDEYFDRLIRSESDLEEKFNYITANPWNAGIVSEGHPYPWVWFPGCDFDVTESNPAFRRDAGKDTRDAYPPRRVARDAGDGVGDLRARGAVVSRGEELWRDVSPNIVIGTHALLYEGAEFSKLGLVVIDEQHKFGVMQKARLIGQGVAPDVLVMTATPIPRTLTMTIYGDLDVSTLDEMPPNRGKIITAVRDEAKLPEVVKFIREHLEKGRQAYIVYPLIDESEKLEAKAATREFEKWKKLLEPMRCELLHGRVDAEEKEAVMGRFRDGASKALVATSVIEVGIDVPNANIMLIENAERFGLVQLHQLRGRVGRGGHKSYCVLISNEKKAGESFEKLKILEATSDGFKIAEEDLKLRGPGDLLGTAQSGLAPLKIGDLLKDGELIGLARGAVTAIFRDDPHLQRPENQYFRELIRESRKPVLSQVS